ncbi:hypothetical protein KAR48_17200 [bacterium]|nr:hypothetical protein [bacterium]
MKNFIKYVILSGVFLVYHSARTQDVGRWQIFGLGRYNTTTYKESLFNPDGMAVEYLNPAASTLRWSQMLSWQGYYGKLGARARYRAELNDYPGWTLKGHLQEAALDFELGNIMLTAGRSILRWGTGYAFNPTDFVAPIKLLSDPENRDGTASGRDLCKLEYFNEKYSIALCAVLPAVGTWSSRLRHPATVFRFYTNFAGVDISILGRFAESLRPTWGINGAYVLGERLELHGELRYSTQRELVDFTLHKREELTAVAGFQITLPGSILLIGEYFHQHRGLTTSEWNRLIDGVEKAGNEWYLSPSLQNQGAVLQSLRIYEKGRAMRDYCFLHGQLPEFHGLSFRGTVFLNLQDAGRLLIPEIGYNAGNHLAFYCRGIIFQGRTGSEYGEMFHSYSIEGGVRFHI